MNKCYTGILAGAIFLLITHAAVASFAGALSEKREKYSLKNLDKINKNYSLSTLHISNNFQFKGIEELSSEHEGGSVEVISMMRLENGTTSYVFPYRYKVKVPKFKTPSAPAFR